MDDAGSDSSFADEELTGAEKNCGGATQRVTGRIRAARAGAARRAVTGGVAMSVDMRPFESVSELLTPMTRGPGRGLATCPIKCERPPGGGRSEGS